MSSPGIFIKSPKDFKKALKEGDKFSSPRFVLYSIPAQFAYSRLGISISSRNVPLATKRNRIKRIVREFWRLGKYKDLGGRDCILVVKRGANLLRNEEIVKGLNYIFDRNLP